MTLEDIGAEENVVTDDTLPARTSTFSGVFLQDANESERKEEMKIFRENLRQKIEKKAKDDSDLAATSDEDEYLPEQDEDNDDDFQDQEIELRRSRRAKKVPPLKVKLTFDKIKKGKKPVATKTTAKKTAKKRLIEDSPGSEKEFETKKIPESKKARKSKKVQEPKEPEATSSRGLVPQIATKERKPRAKDLMTVRILKKDFENHFKTW